MVFTFVSTGHTPAGDSPELMFVPLWHSIPDWKATARAIIATMLVHAYLVFPAFSKTNLSIVPPLACTIMAPLLLAGISKPSDHLNPTSQLSDSETCPKEETVDGSCNEPTSWTSKWTIDSTMVYSSSKIRCIDLRVLLFGLFVTFYDVLCNQYQDERSVTRWPVSAVISIFVTAVWLYLEASVPMSRDVEPGVLSLASTALAGIFSHVNFLDAFGLYDDDGNDANFNYTNPLPENVPESARHFKPILVALWYTTLLSLFVVNRRLVQQQADGTLRATNGQPPNAKKDQLIFGFHIKTTRVNFSWQLRESHVAVSLSFAMLASCLGENWPLEMNTTIAGLLLFVSIVGIQLRTHFDDLDETESLHHVAALGFSALMTILAVGLSHHGVLDSLVSDPKSDWKAGTWSASVFYRLFLSVSLQLKGTGWFTRSENVQKSPREGLNDKEKAPAQEGENSKSLDGTNNG